MKFHRVWAVARKEFIHVIRDPRSLTMAIAIPMLLLGLFGYALTLDVDNVPLVIWDQSGSHASRELISQFTGSRYFSVRRSVDNSRQMEQAIDTGEALAALVIPMDFAGRIDSGRAVAVQLILDGSDSNTATIASGYADGVIGAYSRNIALREIRRSGGREIQAPLEMRPRVWFNADLESKNFIIPGLITIIMIVIATLLTSQTIAREWERGTMEQVIATPVLGRELILGKFFPYFAIGIVDVLLAFLMSRFVFAVPFRGSVVLFFALAAIFLVGAMCLGMLISIVTRTQAVAYQVAMVMTFLPSFLLSGFMFAIANMPRPMQLITYLVPARYFVVITKGIYLKGVGLDILAVPVGLLTIFAIAMAVVANRKFKKKLV